MRRPMRLMTAMAAGLLAATGVARAAAPAPVADPAKPARPKAAGGPAGPATRVSGVTVTATLTIPHVQSTFPASGAKVAPGLLVLRVTYDTRMRPDGWSYAHEVGVAYPDCGEAPRLLDDGRSFVLLCRTLPSKSYAIWFNRPPLQDFASRSRRPADAFELKFATTDADPVRTLPEAMKADAALSNVANPIEPDGLAIYGQPHEAPGGG